MRTNCGSPPYMAPEFSRPGSLTSAVDIWALGVVTLQLDSGLPSRNSHRRRLWYNRIVEHAKQCENKNLKTLLVCGMLQKKVRECFSAAQCLEKGRGLDLFKCCQHDIADSDASTPTQQMMASSESETQHTVATITSTTRAVPPLSSLPGTLEEHKAVNVIGGSQASLPGYQGDDIRSSSKRPRPAATSPIGTHFEQAGSAKRCRK